MNGKRCLVIALPWILGSVSVVYPASSNEQPKSALSYTTNSKSSRDSELPIESTIIEFSSGLLNADEAARITAYIQPQLKPFSSSVVPFQQWKIHCISTTSELDLLAKRCRPSLSEEAPSELALDAILLRALIFSPLVKSNLSLVDEKRWLLRQTFSTWYPNLSLSSGSVLRTYITNRQNYGSPSTPVNPSVSGTAFQPNNPISAANQYASSGSSLVTPYTSNSTYTQAYPVFTLNWTFFDPTRKPSIQAAQEALFSSELDTRSM